MQGELDRSKDKQSREGETKELGTATSREWSQVYEVYRQHQVQ